LNYFLNEFTFIHFHINLLHESGSRKFDHCFFNTSGSNEVIGIITVMDNQRIDLSGDDIELLYTLTRRIAFEWEMEANIGRIKQANVALEVLYKITSTIAHSIKLEELLNNTLDAILAIDFLHLKKEAAIFLLDEKNREIILSAHRGSSEDMVRYDQRIKVGECLCGQVAQTGKILLSSNSENNPQHTRHIPHRGEHADLTVPLKSRGKVLGVLNLHRDAGTAFSKEDLDIYEAIGNELGMAIENAMMFKEVQNYSTELERKVEERTRVIRAINEDLMRANRAKSDFLASMSHELRTPLNAIIGFSEVLREKYFGPLTEKQEEYVMDILDSGKHLLALINDILDLAKVESGKIELELSRVNIKGLLENSLIMIKEKAFKHGIKLDLYVPQELDDLEIMADERKLKQVMFNLLSNAAKFTPDGGEIRVMADLVRIKLLTDDRDSETSSGQEPGGTGQEVSAPQEFVRISVEDTGIGIAPDDQEKIFEEFYQVRGGVKDKTPGTGLGLSLAKRLV
jgi:signal transduction histidine kinase